MARLDSKQIFKPLAANIALAGFAANGGSGNISSALSTALSTASNAGGQVPVQPSTSGGVGVMTGSPDNRAEIYLTGTQLKIDDGSGNEVYGRVTFSAAVYTLTYYSLVAGTETAYAFGGSTNIDIEFGYVFDFSDLPVDAIRSLKARRVSDDPTANIPVYFFEALTVTGDWTVPDLTYSPKDVAQVRLTVNGQLLFAGTHFTITVKSFGFSSGQKTAIGYTIKTTDFVVAEYSK